MAGPKAVVTGSLGIDSIRTPAGSARDVLGGAAVYAGLASRIFARTGIVSVVGRDFSYWKQLRGLDVSGVEVRDGKTFRWSGKYSGAMDEAEHLKVELGVLSGFSPKLPESYLGAKFFFLGNASPRTQLEVLEQAKRAKPAFRAIDTGYLWISKSKRLLERAISLADCLVLNDGEARMLTGKQSLIAAAETLSEIGPEYVIIKKGENGALLFCEREGHFFSPSYPVPCLIDPTGAGDSFGGALTGFLASKGRVTDSLIRRGIVYASAVASFTVSGFGPKPLEKLTRRQANFRFRQFRNLVRF